MACDTVGWVVARCAAAFAMLLCCATLARANRGQGQPGQPRANRGQTTISPTAINLLFECSLLLALN